MNKRLYVDFHILQTVPPSCINRDDTGSYRSKHDQFLKEDREDLYQSEHRDGNQPQNHNRDMEYHGR